MALAEIDTPALVIDLDAMERNLQRMARFVADSQARLRPHAKTHKSAVIARKQIALGAVGVCCQKVSEAEVMVRGGVRSVLVSNQVVGAAKLARLAALARQAEIAFCIDCEDNVAEAAAAASRFGVELQALVEIDVGARRCGVSPGEPAVKLAAKIAAAPSLRFKGLQAYQGAAQHIRDHAERKAAIERAIELTRKTIDALHKEALPCEIVAGGGTGTFEMEGASGVYNELQAGSYVFMDADYARNRTADGEPFATFEHALFVYTTVISRPTPERAVVDAGLKALAVDSGMPTPFARDGVTYGRASDEHGVLAIDGASEPLGYGDKLRLVPGHCDPTVNLHDWYVCVRGLAGSEAHVEALWPVEARGCLF